MSYFIGVDVGTSSARAGLVKKTENGGKLIKFHSEEIQIFKPSSGFFEQSSSNIWQKVCECIKIVTSEIRDKSQIKGIGFDATCSLVLLDKNLQPLTASPTKKHEQNVIMWLDHRAQEEADFINSLKHDCLQFVGGKISLEMEVPKLLWLKKNLFEESFNKIHFAFDLPDFLTFKATGKDSRSVCSLTCKWNYDAIKGEFPKDYFKSIGLEELCENNFKKIGDHVLFPGDLVGELSKEAADEMNLLPGIAIGTSMIDAHAGAIGLIGSSTSQQRDIELTSKLILIAGTSTCHMSITRNILFCPNIWGPYKNALIPNFFLHEAGQSACGILIDYILSSHQDYEKVLKQLNGKNIHDYLYCEILRMSAAENLKSFHELTKNFHFYPDFHGNRSPIADSTLTGMAIGLTMHNSIAISYLAIIQALVYSTKHIIESLYQSGRDEFKSILICGGLSKNKLYVQTTADVCKIPVLSSFESESVLIGSSMLGAKASGIFSSLEESINELKNEAYQIEPDWNSFDYHDRKYRVFLKMLNDQNSYKIIMNE
ncbi:hypothetical protein PVAND_011147 [Polypedilum vanderplanki]|uniref:FGGY carbohydrate kinase domain-containing protein n=1 Tax=Polypedilum vanderplanki TaxID=319348 RepID=A0A9J6CHQ2_POLVA|nr:hypothetical protein PVAND_011147 [Polypedilum vanderplanki]